MVTKIPFHVLVKPIGPVCNLRCAYCFYLEKQEIYPREEDFRMSLETLERFIKGYIDQQPGPEVNFSWQGGEPTLLGLDFFREVVRLQQKYLPSEWVCTNALQ